MNKKVFPIDKTLNKIFNEALEKFEDRGVSRDQIKDAFYIYFKNAGNAMKSFSFPTIIFPKFGRLIGKSKAIENYSKKFLKEGDENSSSQLINAADRISAERKKRKRK